MSLDIVPEPNELARREPLRLRLDDADTYKMLSRGDTVGVFQMEASGMRRFITELKPTCFDDVIAALSLFRPGPLDARRRLLDVLAQLGRVGAQQRREPLAQSRSLATGPKRKVIAARGKRKALRNECYAGR